MVEKYLQDDNREIALIQSKWSRKYLQDDNSEIALIQSKQSRRIFKTTGFGGEGTTRHFLEKQHRGYSTVEELKEHTKGN